MRIATVFLLVGLLGLSTGATLAAPDTPPDEKEWHYIMTGARGTIPEEEPNNTCPTSMSVQCGDVVDAASIEGGTDVDWYKLTVPNGMMITVGTDAGVNCASPYLRDSYVEIYYNCGTQRVARDDDSGPGNYSLVTYTVPAGSGGEYEIKVRGYSSSYTGCYKVFFNCSVPPQPPVNDACVGVVDIPRWTSGTLNGDLTLANDDFSPGTYPTSCTGYSAAGKDVVYRLVLQAEDVVDLSYIQPNFDASVYIISDCANASGSCIIGAEYAPSGQPETVHWACPTAATYYLICDTYSGGGPFTLNYSIIGLEPNGVCCAPDASCSVTTQAVCLTPNIWYPEWTSCTPENPCPQLVGACCAPDGSCAITAQEACVEPGIWHIESTDCATNPCPEPPGACCNQISGDCTITTPAGCQFEWIGAGTQCNSSTCPTPTCACCDPATGICTMRLPLDCQSPLVTYCPALCMPNPCPAPVPIERSTWGHIKTRYR